MDFIFEQICTGGDRNFGYLIGDRDSQTAALVDPSYVPKVLIERAEAQGLTVTHILNTHGHHDHINGNEEAIALTGATLTRDSIKVGAIDIQVIPTPGHTQDHVTLYIPNYNIALTGDHLFVGKIGGTPDESTSRQQYDSLHLLLDTLPPETTIWPGHDYGCRPISTLQLEAATNPFLLAPSFEAFCQLKQEWPTFKVKHGLR